MNSVERVLNILVCLAEKNEWGLVELSEKLDLPPSTAHRLLKTLLLCGYIEKQGNSKSYRVGRRLVWLAGAIVNNCDVKTVAKPYLLELAERIGETVHLCTLVEYETFYLEKITTAKSFFCNSTVGYRLPAHVSGVGKALLAFMAPGQLEQYFDSVTELKRFTQKSITDKEKLREHLAEIRMKGYSIDDQEAEEGLVCVAAPIFDYTKTSIASISVSGPVFRMTPAALEKYIPIVKATADNISKSMGYYG